MRLLLRLISYLSHPLLIPFAGTLLYFLVTPKYSPLAFRLGNILPIFILTVVIPVISFLILRNLGLVSSVFLPTRTERKYPLIISISVLLMVVLKVIPSNYTVELYYYFIGMIAATGACFLLLFLNVKGSLHMMGMGSLLMFLIGLSVHFEINITLAISLCTLATGLAATARLYLRAHNRSEVAVGFLVGFISQLLIIRFWL